MNTATTERVPSPTAEIVREAASPQLPAEVEASHERMRQRQEQHPGVPAAFLTGQPFSEVVGAIAGVMVDLHPVEKGGLNKFHDYKYARMQDILQMLTPLMGKHGLVVFQYERRHQMFDDGKVMAITYDFVVAHKSGQTWLSEVPQTGMSPCRTSKGTFDDKSTAKCHTSARKYFLLSLFQIPTEDDNDPDNEKRQQRTAGPVPSPDGHVAPHLVQPMQRDTFDAWSDRYLAFARTSKNLAELDQWDQLNDDPLTQMDANEKGKSVYERVLREFDAIRAKLQPPPVQGNPADQSFYQQTRAEVRNAEAAKLSDVVPPAEIKRPDDCPNAEREPDAFISWSAKRMAAITTAAELDLIFEQIIDPAADGMMPPDYAAVQAEYEANKKRLGGE
jgi:hypothetical protein